MVKGYPKQKYVKYNVKTLKIVRGVKEQGGYITFQHKEIINLTYVYVVIYTHKDNHKPDIYNIYKHTQKRERNPHITLKRVIKSKEKELKKKGTQNIYKNNPLTINKMAITTYLSIITLNVN